MVLDATDFVVKAGTSTECASAFLHRVIDCLIQQVPFSTLCSEFDISPKCPTETSITALSVAVSGALQAAANSGETGDPSGLPHDFKGVFDARLVDLKAAQEQAATSQSGQMLKDFDWSLRLTVASNTAASVRDPKLLLSLRAGEGTATGAGSTHLLELSADALDDAVASLEKAAQVMQQAKCD